MSEQQTGLRFEAYEFIKMEDVSNKESFGKRTANKITFLPTLSEVNHVVKNLDTDALSVAYKNKAVFKNIYIISKQETTVEKIEKWKNISFEDRYVLLVETNIFEQLENNFKKYNLMADVIDLYEVKQWKK